MSNKPVSTDVPNPETTSPSHIVGIGASAGGLEAIDAFFKQMPADSGCGFVVVQHLSPEHKSLMVELLSKRTQMPVSRAEEGMPVEANQVYLIPPNHDLRIFHGKLLLNEQHDRHGGINLPIDIFLRSLAEDQTDKAVAIILSGTGSDGTRGIRAIKEKIGMVMVQSDESAAFDGMPRSAIATGLVDYVLAAEEMPSQLISYIHHPYAKKTDSTEALLTDEDSVNRIFSMLRERTGVDFTYYKPSTMVRRIERRMSVNQILSLRDYVHFLERYPVEIDTLHKDLLIGVTNFFRDPKAFRELEEKWLVEIIKRADGKPIRIWISGCSTGEEAYSFAILCQEIMNRLDTSAEIKIFATDVDKDAISTAGAGTYPENISADVAPALLSKYFHRRENDYLISRQIREMVVFAQHNVIKDPPFTNIELISCRNLLIYLQPVLQQRVMELFNFSLNPNGIMMLGTSETTGDMADYFEPLHHKWKIYRSRGRKRKDALSEQAAKFNPQSALVRPHTHTSIPGRSYMHDEERLVERLLKSAAERYLPFSMVINDRMELLHMVGEAHDYLQFPTGKMLTDITKLAHNDLAIPISTGVQKILKEQISVDYSNIHLRNEDGPAKTVSLHIRLLPKTKTQDVLIGVFLEQKSQEQSKESNAEVYDVDKEASQRINDLEQELQFTRENLQATVEELETSNEELQATNEELLASNEELQSTNEELQSVNEELYTVNAEHQSKITELTQVNNDLDNLLVNIGVATVFLDNNLDIRRYTPEVAHFIRIIDQDIGRPFSHLTHDLINVDLNQMIHDVNTTHQAIEQEVYDRPGNTYLMRILPYRVGPNFYSGLLLTFIDINISMQQELLSIKERNDLAQKAAKLGNWDWNIVDNSLVWSDSIESMFGYDEKHFDGTYDSFLRTIHPEDRPLLESETQKCLEDPTRPYRVKHRIVWPNGKIRWMLEQGKVHVDSSGKPARMVGIVMDITDYSENQNALNRSKQLFESTMENLDWIAVQLDKDGRVSFVNSYLLAQTGWTSKEIIGTPWMETLVPEEQQNEMKTLFNAYISGKIVLPEKYTNMIICKDGSKKTVLWNNTPIIDDLGIAIGVTSIGRIEGEIPDA